MSLLKTSLLNGVAVLIKLATTVVLNKVLAIYVGPSGYGVVGQFQSLVGMVTTVASGAINTGVTKYTAEFHNEPERQVDIWRTAGTIGLVGAALFALLMLTFRSSIARWSLASEEYSGVIVWLAAALVLFVVNGLLLAIMNGQKAFVPLISCNIGGSLISAATAVFLVLNFGLYGALVALTLGQALASMFTAVVFQRVSRIPWRSLVGRPDPVAVKKLSEFALMSMTSAVVVPLSHMLIRDGVANQLGWHAVGLWQALWKISETHLMLLTTTLSVYFLPRFSEINNPKVLRAEVVNGYKLVLPLVVLSSLLLYLIRESLILGLMSKDFIEIADLFGFQLVGDFFKVGSYVLAFTMLSHAQTRTFVITEVLFAIFLAVSSLVLAGEFGLRGVALAYAITYGIYWVVMYCVFKGLLSRMPGRCREV